MSSSNIEEITSEQTRERESEPTTSAGGRKEKSYDASANIKASLAKVK